MLTGRDGERLASLPAAAANGRGAVLSWPRLAAALPDGPLREALEPVTGIRALAPVARAVSRIREYRVLNADTKTVARLTSDEMAVSYPARAQAEPRLSVLPVRGYQPQADRLSTALAASSQVSPSGRSALEVVLAAAACSRADGPRWCR